MIGVKSTKEKKQLERKEKMVADELLNEAAELTAGNGGQHGQAVRILYFGIAALSSFLCIFHLYSALSGTMSISRLRIVHICVILIIAILLDKHKRLSGDRRIPIYEWFIDSVFIVVAVFASVYMYAIDLQLFKYTGSPNTPLFVIAVVLTAAVLVVAKRFMGLVMPLIAGIALIYVFWGQYLPGVFYHREYSLYRIASCMLLSEDGIMGTPLTVSASTVMLFVIFGCVLSECGSGQAFIDLVFAMFGKIRGGPAKVAVLSSALFGSINGSAIANVVTTGTFTIPLMKRVGYPDYYSGAVEAVSSTGGQIMPPIMGAAAFIMAQVLGVPYLEVVKAAVIPAVLYFAMVFISVDFQAVKSNIGKVDRESVPRVGNVFKRVWYLLLPIASLIYFMIGAKMSANKSALYSIGIAVIVSSFSKECRLSLHKGLNIFVNGGKGIISVALACATAGIIIGCLSLTGLAVKLSSILVSLAAGNLYVLMLLIALVGIVLGMGLPTTGVYVILSSLAAPALVQLGVSPMAAHMYVFYYGVIAVITPPVAVASYAAAGISGASPNKTGWQAVKLGLAGFILPVTFVLNPSVLMEGPVFNIILSCATMLLALMEVSSALTGIYVRTIVGRILIFISAMLLLDGGVVTDMIGIAFGGLIYALEYINHKKQLVGD